MQEKSLTSFPGSGLRKTGRFPMKTVVIGLGNTILSDDGAGIYIARYLGKSIRGPETTIIETESAGMNLMEMLDGYDRAILVDSIQLEGEIPGTVFRLKLNDLKITPRLSSSHDIDIVTAIELGKKLGLKMPEDVIIFAVQTEDVLTIHEGCTEKVEKVLPRVAAEIEGMIKGNDRKGISIKLSERRKGDA
jgi:hydrogenase maturation protease